MSSPAIRVRGRFDGEPSRGLWLVKWLLLIPHLVVLSLLWLAFTVLTIVAFFAILLTGRYPRSIFACNVGVLRWTWRVWFYGYGARHRLAGHRACPGRELRQRTAVRRYRPHPGCGVVLLAGGALLVVVFVRSAGRSRRPE